MMSLTRIASFAYVVVLGVCTTASADPPVADSGPFADGKVIHAVGSGTVASRALQKTSFTAAKGQIKFEVQILSVDSETRDKIYAELGDENVQTQITQVTDPSAEMIADEELDLGSRHTVTTSSIVSTAVISPDQVERLYVLAQESDNSKVLARPNIIAGDGQAASLQQQVQRPFLSDLQEVEHEGQVAVQTGIQVLSEGTDVTVLGEVDGEALKVRTKIQHSRVADVQHHHVYGVGEGQKTIQVPSHEVRQATATARLLPKQTLLLDPYFQSNTQTESVSGTPILSNLPYLQKTFKQAEPKQVTMNTIVLLKAKQL
nr:type II and III secretion system protein [Rhodopirellula sp. SM50]